MQSLKLLDCFCLELKGYANVDRQKKGPFSFTFCRELRDCIPQAYFGFFSHRYL